MPPKIFSRDVGHTPRDGFNGGLKDIPKIQHQQNLQRIDSLRTALSSIVSSRSASVACSDDRNNTRDTDRDPAGRTCSPAPRLSLPSVSGATTTLASERFAALRGSSSGSDQSLVSQLQRRLLEAHNEIEVLVRERNDILAASRKREERLHSLLFSDSIGASSDLHHSVEEERTSVADGLMSLLTPLKEVVAAAQSVVASANGVRASEVELREDLLKSLARDLQEFEKKRLPFLIPPEEVDRIAKSIQKDAATVQLSNASMREEDAEQILYLADQLDMLLKAKTQEEMYWNASRLEWIEQEKGYQDTIISLKALVDATQRKDNALELDLRSTSESRAQEMAELQQELLVCKKELDALGSSLECSRVEKETEMRRLSESHATEIAELGSKYNQMVENYEREASVLRDRVETLTAENDASRAVASRSSDELRNATEMFRQQVSAVTSESEEVLCELLKASKEVESLPFLNEEAHFSDEHTVKPEGSAVAPDGSVYHPGKLRSAMHNLKQAIEIAWREIAKSATAAKSHDEQASPDRREAATREDVSCSAPPPPPPPEDVPACGHPCGVYDDYTPDVLGEHSVFPEFMPCVAKAVEQLIKEGSLAGCGVRAVEQRLDGKSLDEFRGAGVFYQTGGAIMLSCTKAVDHHRATGQWRRFLTLLQQFFHKFGGAPLVMAAADMALMYFLLCRGIAAVPDFVALMSVLSPIRLCRHRRCSPRDYAQEEKSQWRFVYKIIEECENEICDDDEPIFPVLDANRVPFLRMVRHVLGMTIHDPPLSSVGLVACLERGGHPWVFADELFDWADLHADCELIGICSSTQLLALHCNAVISAWGRQYLCVAEGETGDVASPVCLPKIVDALREFDALVFPCLVYLYRIRLLPVMWLDHFVSVRGVYWSLWITEEGAASRSSHEDGSEKEDVDEGVADAVDVPPRVLSSQKLLETLRQRLHECQEEAELEGSAASTPTAANLPELVHLYQENLVYRRYIEELLKAANV